MKRSRLSRRTLLGAAFACLALSGVPANAAPPAIGQRYAVIVALDYHTNPANRLRYTVSDARRFQEFLKAPEENVALLTDTEFGKNRATRENILAAIRRIAGKAKPADTFWFYFSGHGRFLPKSESSFLVPADIRSLTDTSGVSVRDLRQLLADPAVCRAGTRILALDACESGSDKAWTEVPASAAPYPSVPGLMTFAAARPDRKAFETDASPIAGGIFTYYLCAGLAGASLTGQADTVSLEELQRYVIEQVNQTCERIGEVRQEPVFLVGNRPLATPASASAWKSIVVGRRDAEALAALKIAEAGSLPANAFAERPPLEPGAILVVATDSDTVREKAQAALSAALLERQVALYSGEIAPEFLEVLRDPKRTADAADAAEHLSARLLLRVSVKSTSSPSTFAAGNVINRTTLRAEVIDVFGKVRASAEWASSPKPSGPTDALREPVIEGQIDEGVRKLLADPALLAALPKSG